MEQTECFETLAYKIQMLGNYPEESIKHSEHGESLKSRIWHLPLPLSVNSFVKNSWNTKIPNPPKLNPSSYHKSEEDSGPFLYITNTAFHCSPHPHCTPSLYQELMLISLPWEDRLFTLSLMFTPLINSRWLTKCNRCSSTQLLRSKKLKWHDMYQNRPQYNGQLVEVSGGKALD